MTRQQDLLASALRRLRWPVLVPLVGGNALVMAVAALGLTIPDSHAWQVLVSLLLAFGLACAVLLWNATALRRVRTDRPSVSLWTGALLLGMFLLVAAALWHAASLASTNVEVRAGYWNSQMPTAVRHAFSYQRLITLQNFAIAMLQWVLMPALLLPVAMETVTCGFRTDAALRGVRVLGRVQHWSAAVLVLGVPAVVVPQLASWHPAHSVTGETLSAILRLALAGLLAVLGPALLLCVDAELLHRTQAVRARPAKPGEPA